MVFDEEVVLGQSKRQDLTDQAIRIADDIRQWEPPDIPARKLGELSPGRSAR
jgi:hypothetical protein